MAARRGVIPNLSGASGSEGGREGVSEEGREGGSEEGGREGVREE